MSTRYAHIAYIKGIAQYVFTSRWSARAWLEAALEDNGLTPQDGRTERLRIVPANEQPTTAGLKLR